MKYLVFEVPLPKDSFWIKETRKLLKDYKVQWNVLPYNISVLCLQEAPEHFQICSFMQGKERFQVAPCVRYDHLEAFTSVNKKYHYVSLAPSAIQPSEQLSKMIDGIRSTAEKKNCMITNPKRMGVIIGRIPVETINLNHLQEILKNVDIHVDEYRIQNVVYLDSENRKPLDRWEFFETESIAENEYKKEYLHHLRNAGSNIQLLDPNF